MAFGALTVLSATGLILSLCNGDLMGKHLGPPGVVAGVVLFLTSGVLLVLTVLRRI